MTLAIIYVIVYITDPLKPSLPYTKQKCPQKTVNIKLKYFLYESAI